jgi:hypothetical protein
VLLKIKIVVALEMCITEDRNCIGIELKKKPSLRSYPYRRAASAEQLPRVSLSF